jgi:hypothetical protein
MRYLTDLLRPPPPVRRYQDIYAVEENGVIWTLTSPSERVVPVANRKNVLLIPGTRLEVAKVVAAAWLPNPKGATRVVHRDGNPHNVSVTNLAWEPPRTIYAKDESM